MLVYICSLDSVIYKNKHIVFLYLILLESDLYIVYLKLYSNKLRCLKTNTSDYGQLLVFNMHITSS